MFLFILESIGTSELILIGIIALIFLGPRKLPQIARTVGKMMAEFRTTTNEFKSTWEREVNFEEEAQALRSGELQDTPAPIPREESMGNNSETLAMPEIRPADATIFEESNPIEKSPEVIQDDSEDLSDKKNWL